MSLKRWSLARCQNVNHINKLFQDKPERIEHMEDINCSLVNSDYLKALILIGKKYAEIDEIINKYPEINRDIKIAKANIEYEKLKDINDNNK